MFGFWTDQCPDQFRSGHLKPTQVQSETQPSLVFVSSLTLRCPLIAHSSTHTNSGRGVDKSEATRCSFIPFFLLLVFAKRSVVHRIPKWFSADAKGSVDKSAIRERVQRLGDRFAPSARSGDEVFVLENDRATLALKPRRLANEDEKDPNFGVLEGREVDVKERIRNLGPEMSGTRQGQSDSRHRRIL